MLESAGPQQSYCGYCEGDVLLSEVTVIPVTERARDALREFFANVGCVVGAVAATAIVLGLTLGIYLLLVSIIGFDIWWEGPSGRPGTGDPHSVLGALSFSAAVTIAASSWALLKRPFRGRRGASGSGDANRVPPDIRTRVVQAANTDGHKWSQTKSAAARSHLLGESRTALEGLVSDRREWLVQTRRFSRLETTKPYAFDQLDRVVQLIDETRQPQQAQ